MRTYISIPISGKDYEEQKAKAAKVAERLRKEHFNPITPFDIVTDPNTDYATAMGKCVEVLLKCDFIYLCKGWDRSKGCRAEYYIAKVYGLTINKE